jgi:hypothetical protein
VTAKTITAANNFISISFEEKYWVPHSTTAPPKNPNHFPHVDQYVTKIAAVQQSHTTFRALRIHPKLSTVASPTDQQPRASYAPNFKISSQWITSRWFAIICACHTNANDINPNVTIHTHNTTPKLDSFAGTANTRRR